MRSLQKKLLFYIVIIGVIPVLLFSFFYYDILSNRITDKLYSESYDVLKQMDNKLVVKISRLQNTVDIILNDAEFFSRVREVSYNSDEYDKNIKYALDEIYNKFLRSEKSLKSIIFFAVNGDAYVSGEPLEYKDPVRFVMPYNSIGADAGVLSWLGLKDSLDEVNNDIIVAGTMLRDGCYMKDHVYVGSIYMIFDNNLFIGKEKELSEINTYESSNNTDELTVSIYDSTSKLIYSQGDRKLRNVFLERPLSQGLAGHGEDTGSFDIKIDESDYFVIYYTSPITGWKFVLPVMRDLYFGQVQFVRYMTLLAFMLIFAIWYICNYFLVNRIMLPIRELMDAMQNVEKDNFNTELQVRSKDEFGVIINGFNAMVTHIRTLLGQIRAEEEKRRQLDILMLRYQMNPHFLYNTLAAIRLIAIMNKQSKIAEMLTILGRFLRNAILTVNSTLDVKSEIANINDYISLYQLRYNDQLKIDIHADKSCYNYQILSMLCQPIIENAIMHGLDEKLSSNENGIIKINITDEKNCLYISVYDNGIGISEEKLKTLFTEEETDDISPKGRLHIGLLNTHKRIKLIFGEEYGLEVKSKVGEYTEVKIKLPKIENTEKFNTKE